MHTGSSHHIAADPDGGLATPRIQAAIDAAAAAGGGTVVLGTGRHESGSLRLRSHVELHLDPGAHLAFVADRAQYPAVPARWEGATTDVHAPCLYAHGETDVAITGFGVIDGQGQPWWAAVRGDGEPLAHPRPTLIGLHGCRRVTIRDVTLRDSPSWTVHPLLCQDVTISGITIVNPADSPNTDGIDPESCRDVRINGCHIDVGDDCIAIKAGTEATAERVPCENITITGCTMVHGHGGVVMGSEMAGGVRNVVIGSCVFQGTDRGIRVKTRRGRGGVVEDVRVTNVVMDDVSAAIVLHMHYFCGPGGKDPVVADRAPHPVTDATPLIRRVHVAQVSARNVHAAAVFVHGLAEQPVSELTLTDVEVSYAAEPRPGRPALMAGVPEMVRGGILLAHARDVDLRGVRVTGCDDPGVRLEACTGVRLSGVGVNGVRDPAPVVVGGPPA